MHVVDARGLSCPEPALMAGAAFDDHPDEPVKVIVSWATAKVNVSEIARRKGRAVAVERDGDDYIVIAS